MTLDPRAHDQGVVAALQAIGRPVGYAAAPEGALDGVRERTGPGYYVVFPVDGGGRDGTAADPDELAVLPYRIHCIDRGPDGVAWLAGRAETAMASLAVTNRHVMRVEPVTRGDIRQDFDVPSLFIATPLYHVHTSPT